MSRLGPMELVLILAIALVIFGPSKLPEIGKAIGKGLNEFKKSANGKDETAKDETENDEEQ